MIPAESGLKHREGIPARLDGMVAVPRLLDKFPQKVSTPGKTGGFITLAAQSGPRIVGH